jgi:hypothetical protein
MSTITTRTGFMSFVRTAIRREFVLAVQMRDKFGRFGRTITFSPTLVADDAVEAFIGNGSRPRSLALDAVVVNTVRRID